MKVLTIISHTEHYRNADGTIVGLGSTVTEINHLVSIFDEIHHIAMLHPIEAPASALPYTSDRIKFIPIKAVGGVGIINKFKVLFQAPAVLNTIQKTLKKSSCFQFRAPTGIGVYVIPYLILFSTKLGWFKYAGNWNQKGAPVAYRFQKWLLKKQRRKVTINGQWPNQPKHCLTFENPCLTMLDIETGNQVVQHKSIKDTSIDLCFVGRLEHEKGIGLFIEALHKLDNDSKSKIGKVHIVGSGKQSKSYEQMTVNSSLEFIFYGVLSRHDVHEVYKKSHAIVLPSASEGFPKVIAEALNYGCIPVVTDVSAVAHYVIHEKNGFLLDVPSVENVLSGLQNILSLSSQDYASMIGYKREDIQRFTFAHYNNRIQTELTA